MPKRTIAEWVTVARISRNVGHVFFEGPSDARVIAHASGYPANIDFRSAEEVDEDPCDGSAFLGGNKLRLVNLAIAAEESGNENIRCVIDADFSPFVSCTKPNRHLIQTEYANLPVSTLTFDWLRGFFMKGYGLVIDEKFWNLFSYALKFAFVARFHMACLEKKRAAPSLSDFMTVKASKMSFDENSYVKRYFQITDVQAINTIDQFRGIIEWLDLETRNLSNSNDLFDIIHSILRKSGKIGGSVSSDSIRQAYFSAIDDDIFRNDCFTDLRRWLETYGSDLEI